MKGKKIIKFDEEMMRFVAFNALISEFSENPTKEEIEKKIDDWLENRIVRVKRG